MVSDVAILIGHALRAFLTAKVVFLKEHGSVAWSGSARSELADLCLLSALTPDAERRKYSAGMGAFDPPGACFVRHGGSFPAWPGGNGMAGRPAGSRRQPVFG